MKTILLLLPLLLSTTTADKNKKLFSIDARTSIENKSGEIKLYIIPEKGYKWGKEYNARLTLDNGEIVNFPKLKFSNKNGDFKQEGRKAVVTIPVVGLQNGKETITGQLNCLICNETLCRLFKNVKINFPIIVQ